MHARRLSIFSHAGVSLADDGAVAERQAGSGWGVQVGDTWTSRDTTTITLVCKRGYGEMFIGVVGRNFISQDWGVPLQSCSHAAVLELSTGKLFSKGQPAPRVLPQGPIQDGERFNLVLDMMEREMTVERLGIVDGVEEVVASVSIERLPIEVALCVGFGGDAQRVRIVSSEKQKSEFGHWKKVHKDLWDDDNKITLQSTRKTVAEKLRDAEISAATGNK